MNKVRIGILLAMIAAISFWAGGHFRPDPAQVADVRTQPAILYYVDPMTPGFRSDQPGIAPCGMPLEPVYADAGDGSAPALPPGAVKIRSDRRQLIGVRSEPVEPLPMTYTLRLYGKVVTDETRVFRVNASTDSWIRELSDVTTGSFVKKGQRLAEALAPAYYNAQVTYLIALDNMDRIRQQLGGEVRHQQGDLANNQMRVAVQALQNLGIGDAQVEELARTRKARPYLQVRAPTNGFVLNRNISLNQWFKAADEFYTIADLRKVWVYCDVYEDEARHLRPGLPVQVRHPQLGRTFAASVSEVLPLFDPISKTLKVRLDIDNPDYELRPEMFVDVEIPVTMPPGLYVASDAVLYTGTRAIVYADLGDGVMEPRTVETGWRLGGWVEIRRGLMPGERVVVAGNFLIDSESRMKTALATVQARVATDPVCGMEVVEETAQRADRTLQHAGMTYYFCSTGCQEKFRADADAYLDQERTTAPGADAVATAGEVVDPVCGMPVNRLKSEYAGWFVKLHGQAYHFCSRQCMKRFFDEPARFAVDKGDDGRKAMRNMAPVAAQKRAPAPGLPATAVAASPPAPVRWDRATDGGISNRSRSSGEIDWNGSDQVPPAGSTRDWKGWGRFPGSEYLGLNDGRNKADRPAPAASRAGADAAADQPPGSPPVTAAGPEGQVSR